MNMASQRLTRSVGTALMVMVVLAGLGAPTAARGVTPEDQTDLVAVTREIILNTAEVGLDEAGTRLLGPTAWRFLKKAATPVFDRLKQQYPTLFGVGGRGTPPVQQQAQAAAQTFKDDQALQAMLLTGFSTLETGQQEVLTEVRVLKVKLDKINTAIADMGTLNRERHDQILAELQRIREQDRGVAPSEGAARVIRVVLDDDFRKQQRWTVAPESPRYRSYYQSAGLVLENGDEKWAMLYDLKTAGFFIPPVRIELTLQHLGGPSRGWYGLMFGAHRISTRTRIPSPSPATATTWSTGTPTTSRRRRLTCSPNRAFGRESAPRTHCGWISSAALSPTMSTTDVLGLTRRTKMREGISVCISFRRSRRYLSATYV